MTFHSRCRRNRLDQQKRKNAALLGYFRRIKKSRRLTLLERNHLEAHEIISERMRS
jgi:hypothetical protein